jgi:hypothetical protein
MKDSYLYDLRKDDRPRIHIEHPEIQEARNP